MAPLHTILHPWLVVNDMPTIKLPPLYIVDSHSDVVPDRLILNEFADPHQSDYYAAGTSPKADGDPVVWVGLREH